MAIMTNIPVIVDIDRRSCHFLVEILTIDESTFPVSRLIVSESGREKAPDDVFVGGGVQRLAATMVAAASARVACAWAAAAREAALS